MNNSNVTAIDNYTAVSGSKSQARATTLARWSAASQRGPLPTSPPNMPISQDCLVIGGIIVAGVAWVLYRRQIARGAKKLETDAEKVL